MGIIGKCVGVWREEREMSEDVWEEVWESVLGCW